jgi:hypothetical protein
MEAGTDDAKLGFEQDIKPLFRESDRDAMSWMLDLGSFEDVKTHAGAILEAVEEGTMPCDGAWPAERVETFRRWMEAGTPA